MYNNLIFIADFRLNRNGRSVFQLRRFLCLLLTLFLLFPCTVMAEEEDDSWAKKPLPRERLPETIQIVPWDEIPAPSLGQHHYLLLCIDQWKSRPRPDGIEPPTDGNGNRRDFFGNTDGIVILTLDTAARRIMLASIVRDATILKPNTTDTKQFYGRINYVYNDYGPEALCRLISEHLGIKIEKYILFNFSQIQDIIDLESLDGVYIDLNRNEIAYLARFAVPKRTVIKADGYYAVKGDPEKEDYLKLHYNAKNHQTLDFSIPFSLFTQTENGMVKESATISGTNGSSVVFERNGGLQIVLADGSKEKGSYGFEHNRLEVMTGDDVHLNNRAEVGTYHMKGHSALLYMRIRKSSRGDTDFMRTQRVRNVLSALADECRSFTLDQANDLANSIMQHNDKTNMTLKDMTDAASWAYSLRDCTIEEFRVPPQADVRSITFGQMSALEINWTSVRRKYNEFLDHTTLVRDVDFMVMDEDD